ncbi:hypothetical protein [Ruegeria meonggei]|uniref:hypothetical protein n=1 Tax=Ruegeria meonggei TaxID=1446476 RepID=UPI003670B844
MILADREIVKKYLSENSISELRELFERLAAQRLHTMRFGEPPTGFNVSDKIRAYGQANLWRCLQLCGGAEMLRQNSSGLSAIILSRSAVETVAAYSHFAVQLPNKLKPLKTSADLERVDEFVLKRSFATREKSAASFVASDGVDVNSVSILTQIGKLEKRHPGLSKKYEILSDFAHPNAFGTLNWFGKTSRKEGRIRFSDDWDHCEQEALGWSVIAIWLLETLEADIAKVEDQLPALSCFGHKMMKLQ